MGVFAPGTWAGVNDSLAINRQNQKDQLSAQEAKLRMQRQALDMEQSREQQARDLEARRGLGAGLYGVYGQQPQPMPGAGGPPPGQPMAPPPGQSSAPAGGQSSAPAGGPPQGQQQGPPGGPPQGQMQGPPGGPPRMMPVSAQAGGPPQPPQAGGPPGGPPQDPALARAMGDVAAVTRELSRPGLNAEQKDILTRELGKAQEKVAQLKGQTTPYRTIPTSAPAGDQPQGLGTQPPPAMGASQPQQPSLLKRFVMAAQRNGVPPEALADQIKMLSPIMQSEMREELTQLRGTQAEQNMYIRSLLADNAMRREDRLTTQGDRRLDQGDRKVDQGAQRIEIARKKAETGVAPTASELSDPDTARVFYDIYKKTGRTPPFAWGKTGESDRSAWMKAVKKFSAEDGGGTGIAASQAEGKAQASALTANERRNAGLDVGAKETLADIQTLDGILDRVATKGGAKVLNRPLNKLRDLGSDPEYGQLELATKQVATKYERMLAGGILSVAQLHEGAREDAKKILNGDMTVAEIRAKLPLMKREMDNAQKAGRATSGDVRNRLAGKPDATNDEDQQAIAWAKAHAGDPRAKKILALHGM